MGNIYKKGMPFGLKNDGATCQQAMFVIFHDMLHDCLDENVGDMIVKAKARHQHVEGLREVFTRFLDLLAQFPIERYEHLHEEVPSEDVCFVDTNEWHHTFDGSSTDQGGGTRIILCAPDMKHRSTPALLSPTN